MQVLPSLDELILSAMPSCVATKWDGVKIGYLHRVILIEVISFGAYDPSVAIGIAFGNDLGFDAVVVLEPRPPPKTNLVLLSWLRLNE